MDTPERPPGDGHPSPGDPAPWPPAPLPARAMPGTWEDPLEAAAAPPARPLTLRTAWRAVRRHWWQILLIWAAGSAALVALAYYKVNPTYEAKAIIKVEPAYRPLVAQQFNIGGDFGPFLKTQAFLVTSPDVLGTVLKDPRIGGLPRFRQSLDAEDELRRSLVVTTLPDTHVLVISMAADAPDEAAQVVNAVVTAYLDEARNWTDRETQLQIKRLKEMQRQYKAEVTALRSKLEELKRRASEIDVKALSDDKQRMTLEQYHGLKQDLMAIEMERGNAEGTIKFLEQEVRARRREAARPAGPPSGERLDKAVEEIFLASPAAAELNARRDRLRDHLDQARRQTVRLNSDPLAQRLRRDLKQLDEKYQALWREMEPKIRERLADVPEPDQVSTAAEDQVRNLKMQLATLDNRKKVIDGRLKEIQAVTREEDQQALAIQFANEDYEQASGVLQTVERNLAQLIYESHDATRITVIAEARPVYLPQTDTRRKLMAAAPVAVLALVLGLFVLVEAKSGRVADPDDLPARVRVDVIGVVPPLPGARPSRGGARALRDERRRVEEFVQSLDHLRVALCAAGPGGDGRRCVLITSAVGGEGKTTLAAQLAGRCANAGLLTLLVDADLRRPSLGELLEVPEGPGLSDVLAGEAAPEAAMVVIGNAGGFHLLPAGTAGGDPSRLLHGERLGQLLAQLREAFDVVIVDAPPVLAVPDALLLGRWTDGAVLAVRHDSSRFPLVERARRRLASVGVAVLGAVVNGVRSMESGYGAYNYTPYAGRGADAEA